MVTDEPQSGGCCLLDLQPRVACLVSALPDKTVFPDMTTDKCTTESHPRTLKNVESVKLPACSVLLCARATHSRCRFACLGPLPCISDVDVQNHSN